MKPHHLEGGVHHVRIYNHQCGKIIEDFKLSVYRLNGLSVVAGFSHGKKRPPMDKHVMLTATVRSWVESMDKVVESPKPDRWNRCDECGRFIAMADFESGMATRYMETPDSDLSSEKFKTTCVKCNQKTVQLES